MRRRTRAVIVMGVMLKVWYGIKVGGLPGWLQLHEHAALSVSQRVVFIHGRLYNSIYRRPWFISTAPVSGAACRAEPVVTIIRRDYEG